MAQTINSELGKPAVRLGSDDLFQAKKISSGSLVIDRVTGGGFPLGRHVELYGEEAACKSYIAYRTMALSQQRGNLCALIDPEKAFDPRWYAYLGGNPDELLLFQPAEKWNAEDAIGVMMLLARKMDSEFIEVITVDSVAALVTQEEMSKDPREEDRIASQARMMSRALRRITTVNFKTLFLWTNQERTNIGFGAQFSPRVQPGGLSLRYYATQRLELRQAGRVKRERMVADKFKLLKKDTTQGKWIQVRSEKEKSARPYRTGMFVFDSENGEIDRLSEIIQLGLEDELIVRDGNIFTYETLDGTVLRGMEKKFRTLLEENRGVQEEIVEAIAEMTTNLASVGSESPSL